MRLFKGDILVAETIRRFEHVHIGQTRGRVLDKSAIAMMGAA
jgi:hypothetical protein